MTAGGPTPGSPADQADQAAGQPTCTPGYLWRTDCFAQQLLSFLKKTAGVSGAFSLRPTVQVDVSDAALNNKWNGLARILQRKDKKWNKGNTPKVLNQQYFGISIQSASRYPV